MDKPPVRTYSPGDLVWYFRPASQKLGGGFEYLAQVLIQKGSRVSIKIMHEPSLKRNVSINSLRQSSHATRKSDKEATKDQTALHDRDRAGSTRG